MKKIILTSVLFATVVASFAQEEKKEAPKSPWTKGLKTTATFTQTSLTNWAAGGQNSLALSLYAKAFANLKKDKHSWSNSLEVGFGFLDQENTGLRKSDDKIDAITQYNRAFNNEKLSFSTFMNFKSQFAKGFTFDDNNEKTAIISQFAAPAYLFVTIGLEYKPIDYFSVYFSPLTNKNTIVASDTIDETSYGLEDGSSWRFEAGTFLKLNFNKEVVKNVNWESKAEFFTNYVENFGDIDVNWENAIVMKINKYLSANLLTQLIYDKDIDFVDSEGNIGAPRVQFKQVFGLGFSYTM